MPAREPLKLFLLGTPQIVMSDGTRITIENHSMIQLLALLMISPKRMYLRSELCTLFYPEHGDKQAEQNLRQMVHRLRKILHDEETEPILIGEPLTLRLNEYYTYWVDVNELNTLVLGVQKHQHRRLTACSSCIKSLEQSAHLYQNEFMGGIHFRGPLEEWVFVQRSGVLQKMTFVFRTLTAYFLQRGQWLNAQEYVEKWLALDALDEEAAALQVRLFASQGKRTLALQFYRNYAMLLGSRLEIEPSEDLKGLVHAIQNGILSSDKLLTRPPQTGTLFLKSPVMQNKAFEEFRHLQIPFVARVDEVKGVLERLADGSTRLFTITGIGGVGKTRLALHVAKLDTENWFHGVTVVYMQGESDLLKGLLNALNKPPEPGKSVDAQVYAYLKDKEMLLVLDHLDHIPNAKYVLKMLLFQAPKIKIIVTSRERMGIAGEIIIQLSGLAYPINSSPPDAWRNMASVDLFYTSAQYLYPHVTLTDGDLSHIARMCSVLHGFPFAIILASMWVQTLSCEQIARCIQSDINFLKDILKYLPENQRTVRDVFVLAWQRLDGLAQHSLEQVAQMNRPFTLLEAQTQCKVQPEYMIELLDKSFLESVESKHLRIHPLFKPFILEEPVKGSDHVYE